MLTNDDLIKLETVVSRVVNESFKITEEKLAKALNKSLAKIVKRSEDRINKRIISAQNKIISYLDDSLINHDQRIIRLEKKVFPTSVI